MVTHADTPGNAARRRLAALLRTSIAQGDYPDGVIPEDVALARDYGVSRGQARDALSALAGAGALTRLRGVGTHAAAGTGALFNLLAFHGVGGVPEMDVHPKAVTIEMVDTPPLVANRLPGAGTQVLRLEYISAPVDSPHGVSTSYFVLPAAAPLRDADFGRNIYSLLESAGLTVTSSDFLLGAFAADAYTARRLGVAAGSVLLSLDQIMHDGNGEPFAFTVIALRSDRFQLISREHADSQRRPPL